MLRRRLVSLALALLLPLGPVAAQTPGSLLPAQASPPPFLILDQDRLFANSALGKAVIATNEEETDALRREGEALDLQFEAEERELTERRKELEPVEFRRLADAFDEKVVATRREQEEKAAQLQQRIDRRRRDFFREAGPVLLGILEETGAVAIVEQRSILIGKQDLNITEEAIKRLDAAFAAQQQQDLDGTAPDDTGNAPPGDEE
ncbi:OmpH/Skp family outer membrane protein [Halovulum sp. GXIMD14794]